MSPLSISAASRADWSAVLLPESVSAIAALAVATGARLVVVRRPFDLAEDADRRGVEVAGVGQPRDREGHGRVRAVRVVRDEEVVAILAIEGSELYHLQTTGSCVPDQSVVPRPVALLRLPKVMGSPWEGG